MAKINENTSGTEIERKAKTAVDKKAVYGEDIDLAGYSPEAEMHKSLSQPSQLPANVKRKMTEVGVVDDLSQRSGTIIQMDNSTVHSLMQQDGIEVMSTTVALEKYDWLADYSWKAVSVDADKYTSYVGSHPSNGYFIRALPGKKTIFPVQACLYMETKNLAQSVHNIIIAEENSELHIITGCVSASHEDPGIHLGISEFYIKKGAKVSFTMIHSWNPEIAVRPRSGIIIEEDGLFLNNYVLMKPVKTIQMNPSAHLVGRNATARFNSVLVAQPGSNMDIGSKVYLDAPQTRTEIISRALTTGGNIYARGYVEGNQPDVKGHLECRGLILGETGMIHAIPELKGTRAGIDLSHEAAVGKIAEEEVEYLMARGLTRSQATAVIVRGFLRVDITGLPEQLDMQLKKAIEESEKDLM